MAYCDTLCMNNDFLGIGKSTSVARATVPRELLHAAKSPCINIECHTSVPGRGIISDRIYRFRTSFFILYPFVQYVGSRFAAGL